MLDDQQLLSLAMEHHRAGRLGEAEAVYRQLLTRHPGQPDVLHLLGVLAGQTGHVQDAVDLIRRAIVTNPHDPGYHSNLAVWLVELGQLEEAARAHEAAIAIAPDFVEAHFNLGFVRMRQREWNEAAKCYRRVIELRPELGDAHLKLGAVLSAAGRFDDAITALRAGLEHLPRHAMLWNNLGVALRDREDLDGAIGAYRAGLECEQENAALLNNLVVLKDTGLLDEAIACLRRSAALDPARSETYSNLIFTLQFHPDATPNDVIAEQQRWVRRHCEPLRALHRPHSNNRLPDRRLRIGYVSPDLCAHPVGRLLCPLFAQHDRERFEIICYSDCIPDSITAELSAHAALWRDTAEMNDEQLATRIRDDGIDILVDLALHTAGNRLLVFARKPAPVQVSWLGYAGNTGLDAIDYCLTDSAIDPPGREDNLVRLPDCWCCYAPHASLANPELPAIKNDYVTFGSFNAFAKTNERVFELWARILRQTPDARLLLVAPPGGARVRTRSFFQQHGVAPQQLDFLDRTTPKEFFRRHDRIDLALDCFPYNGMTTTCDALWMGVPVITLIGAHPLSRTAFSLLSAVGLREFAASTPDEYVRVASEWTRDLPRLAALRASLRDRMLVSPLMDATRFARNIEAAYRKVWRRWCGA